MRELQIEIDIGDQSLARGGLAFSPGKFSRLVESYFGGGSHHDIGAPEIVGIVGRGVVRRAAGVDSGLTGREFTGDGGT